MTEQSDKPSVDGLITGIRALLADLAPMAAYGIVGSRDVDQAARQKTLHELSAIAERLAVLAGPLEQPQEPRFSMDHGVWHDRVSGQHLYTDDQHTAAFDEAWQALEEAGIERNGWISIPDAIKKLATPKAEQPQEPTSDKANLAQASGVCDLQTALPRWIPVSERVPGGGTDCLVFGQSRYLKAPHIRIDRWDEQHEAPVSWSSATIPIGLGWDDSEWEEVTHWMPLPLPPGESAGAVPSDKPAASSESSVSVPKEQHSAILSLLGKCECEHCKPAASGEQQ